MVKKKFYAVAAGKSVGIFESWEECEEQVLLILHYLYRQGKDFPQLSTFAFSHDYRLGERLSERSIQRFFNEGKRNAIPRTIFMSRDRRQRHGRSTAGKETSQKAG